MGEEKECPLFRRPEILSVGKGIDPCDIDSSITTCEENVNFCKRTDALKRYLLNKFEEMG
jgi:hypothetical protein